MTEQIEYPVRIDLPGDVIVEEFDNKNCENYIKACNIINKKMLYDKFGFARMLENIGRLKYEYNLRENLITLLIDESGSMATNSKFLYTIASTIIIGNALSELCHFEIIGFTTTPTTGHTENIDKNELRQEGLLHHIYKRKNDKLNPNNLGNINCHYDNCDGESLLFAYSRMPDCYEKRNIFVISDGYPNAKVNYDMYKDLTEAIRFCQYKRVNIHSINIGSHENDAKKLPWINASNNHIIISDPSDMIIQSVNFIISVLKTENVNSPSWEKLHFNQGEC